TPPTPAGGVAAVRPAGGRCAGRPPGLPGTAGVTGQSARASAGAHPYCPDWLAAPVPKPYCPEPAEVVEQQGSCRESQDRYGSELGIAKAWRQPVGPAQAVWERVARVAAV